MEKTTWIITTSLENYQPVLDLFTQFKIKIENANLTPGKLSPPKRIVVECNQEILDMIQKANKDLFNYQLNSLIYGF